MRISKNILGVVSFMMFLMGIIYGDLMGAYISIGSIFLMLCFFSVPKILGKKYNIEINTPSEILLLASVIFIYLSFFEKNINIYNIIMSTCCTILFWLFIFYLNIKDYDYKLGIKENIEKNKALYKDYKVPPKTLLNTHDEKINKEHYENKINSFFKSFKLKIKYKSQYQNSWLLTYRYQITSGTKIDDILELQKDLELKLGTKVEIEISTTESNIIYIKIPLKKCHPYTLINCKCNKNKKLEIPLGEDEEQNLVKISLTESSPLLLLGDVGTGKTNLLNIIINNCLLEYKPDELSFILIDKHQTGLDIYEKLPHLVLPLLNNPELVLDYLKSINEEINLRKEKDEEYEPLIVIIDEIFDINASDDEIWELLEPILLYGNKVNIHTIISTSITSKSPLLDKIYNVIKNKIYFYGSAPTDYVNYKNDLNKLPGLINYNDIRIRTPKLEDEEIKKIVNNTKGIE